MTPPDQPSSASLEGRRAVNAEVLDKIPARIAELEAEEADELRFADNLREHAEQHDGHAMSARRQIIGLERILKENGR